MREPCTGLGILRLVGGEGHSLAQGAQWGGGRGPQMCFTQPVVQVGVVAECQLAEFSSFFIQPLSPELRSIFAFAS